MEDKLTAKENVIAVLDRQLSIRARKGEYGVVVVSSATDPYLQWESELQLTRKILETILKHRFPVHIITRSALVERDFDILEEISNAAVLPDRIKALGQGALLTFSFSTLNEDVAKIFEPGATRPSQRLITLSRAATKKFYTGVSLMPLLPGISDDDESLRLFYLTFKTAGANYVLPAGLTLFGGDPHDSRTLVMQAVSKYFPDKMELYQSLFSRYNMTYAYEKALKKRLQNHIDTFQLPDRII